MDTPKSNGILEVSTIPIHTPTGTQATLARLTDTNTHYRWNGSAWVTYSPANDSDVVHKTGAEVIADVKTFSSLPVIPTSAYGAGWAAVLSPPTQAAVYAEMEKKQAILRSVVRSAAATVSVTADLTVFTGVTSTFTLATGIPALIGKVHKIKNAGSGGVTVDVLDASATIYETAAVTSIVIPAGESREFVYDGVYWIVM